MREWIPLATDIEQLELGKVTFLLDILMDYAILSIITRDSSCTIEFKNQTEAKDFVDTQIYRYE